jgi:hypothetical protein
MVSKRSKMPAAVRCGSAWWRRDEVATAVGMPRALISLRISIAPFLSGTASTILRRIADRHCSSNSG